MVSYPFNEIVIIGELEFEVSGSYYSDESTNGFCVLENDEILPFEINFESVLVTLDNNGDTITLDGTIILDSLNCWNVLEKELANQLPNI